MELTQAQKDVLGSLNVLFMHEFPDAFGKAMVEISELYNNKNWEEGNEPEDFKSGWKFGYQKAIWDATIIISQAEDGYLPSDETIDRWLKDQEKEMEKSGIKFEKGIKFGDHEVTKVTFDERRKM